MLATWENFVQFMSTHLNLGDTPVSLLINCEQQNYLKLSTDAFIAKHFHLWEHCETEDIRPDTYIDLLMNALTDIQA